MRIEIKYANSNDVSICMFHVLGGLTSPLCRPLLVLEHMPMLYFVLAYKSVNGTIDIPQRAHDIK